jgi:hypothetical protein
MWYQENKSISAGPFQEPKGSQQKKKCQNVVLIFLVPEMALFWFSLSVRQTAKNKCICFAQHNYWFEDKYTFWYTLCFLSIHLFLWLNQNHKQEKLISLIPYGKKITSFHVHRSTWDAILADHFIHLLKKTNDWQNFKTFKEETLFS